MNWEALGAAGEILGAIAVVASLFYVGKQVKESARSMQGQTIQTLAVALGEMARVAVDDPSFVEMLGKVRNAEALSEHEYARYSGQLLIALRHAEAAHFQYVLGLVELEQLKSRTSSLAFHLRNDSGNRVWREFQDQRPKAFREYIENNYVGNA